MERTMLKLNVEIEGQTQDDVLNLLRGVADRISEGKRSMNDGYQGGKFSFKLTGRGKRKNKSADTDTPLAIHEERRPRLRIVG
jgi:hypothetical protein